MQAESPPIYTQFPRLTPRGGFRRAPTVRRSLQTFWALGRVRPVRPISRLLGRLQVVQFGQQTIYIARSVRQAETPRGDCASFLTECCHGASKTLDAGSIIKADKIE